MSTAIISDIHGNLEALTAVFSDIRYRGINRVVCLGDVVGYGPDPDLCLDIVSAHCDIFILGNHEHAVLNEPLGFYALSREAIMWTRKKLFSKLLKPLRNLRYKRLISSLPTSQSLDDWLLVHGSPREPTMEYVLPQEFVFAKTSLVEELFMFEEKICFGGHTHIPAIMSESQCSLPAGEDGQQFTLGTEKVIVNVGSVGQPRDQDPRSCYVEFDGETVIYHRVTYPIAETQEKIKKAGLNIRLADRLTRGM